MKKIYFLAAALIALASCQSLKEEFQPVFTLEYDNPPAASPVTMTANKTIAEVAAMYTPGQPFKVKKNMVISGIVSTTDKPGNFYKSFYIQDDTGGMEIKIGKNGLYNDYLPGQRVYIDLYDLTVGMYGYKTGNYGGMGMVQVGFADPSGEYETSYLESSLLIDSHIYKGAVEGKVTPEVITESQLPNAKTDTQATNKYVGRLVTLKGLKYAGETFVLLYLDPNQDKKSFTNRVFLSDSNGNETVYGNNHGISTWAMSESKMKEYLYSGVWDSAYVGSGSNFLYRENPETGEMEKVNLGMLRGDGTYPGVDKAAYSVSQYFKMGNTEIQIRTSGYSKFGDKEIPAEVLSGAKTIDVTGVLTLYQGSIQFTVNDISDFVVDGKPLE